MGIELIAKLQPFAIALALGMLIGIERERSHPPGYQALGLRTFILVSLLGAMAAQIGEIWVTVCLTIFIGAIVVAGYLRSSRRDLKRVDIGITTEVAAMVTYAIGYMTTFEPFIALLMGVIVLLVLMGRTRLHEFSRKQLRPEELRATAILLVLAIGILPFLPNKTIDPWNLFNPLQFGSLVLIIALLQFVAYAGIRIFGATKGILLSGFLAGFVSSTAATATLSHQTRKKAIPSLSASAGIILATVAMFLELILIVFIIAPKLLYAASLPILTAGSVFTLIALGIGKYSPSDNIYPVPKNPLSILSAIRLAAFLALMLIIVTIAERTLGHVGAKFVIFITGLVEIHGVILAIATLFHQGQLSAIEAINDIGIAITASFVSKMIIIWGVTRGRFAIMTSVLLIAMLLTFCMTWMFVII